MVKLASYLKSFSFRMGLITFLILAVAFISLRLLIYYQTVENSLDEIKETIETQIKEAQETAKKNGNEYLKQLITAINNNDKDKTLIILIKDREGNITGNLKYWPVLVKNNKWTEFYVSFSDGTPTAHYFSKLDVLPRGNLILVGHDMQKVNLIEKTLTRALIYNLIISMMLSLVISIVIIYLINRRLGAVNRVCEHVIQGDLSPRVPLSRGHDQFDSLAVNFNQMLDWITTLISTVKDSTNSIAHDMRTPLSRHRLKLQTMLENKMDNREDRHNIEQAIKEIDAIVEMFDNILNIAKAEDRSAVEHFGNFSVSEVVRDVVEFYEPLVEQKPLSLTIEITEDLTINGHKHLLAQAVANLIDNAVKYAPKEGSVKVSLRKNESNIEIEVADNGKGVPEEFYEKVKERFFRLDESRQSTGTGLGLSLVDAVAKLHRGQLIISNNNPGLKARIVLPLT